jgi:hypothetical protein
MKETVLARIIPFKQIPEVFDILDELGIKYEKNYRLDDSILFDIYLPEEYDNSIYINSLDRLVFCSSIIISLPSTKQINLAIKS